MFGIIYISWNSFTGKLIALLHWSIQAMNLVTWQINSNCAQEELSYELWPGFKIKLFNSKKSAKKIGGLVHGIRIQMSKERKTDYTGEMVIKLAKHEIWKAEAKLNQILGTTKQT